MGSFLKHLHKFFVNFLIITLIIMLSIQYLIKNDEAYQKLKNFEMAFYRIMNDKYITQKSIEVGQKTQGIIVIKQLQKVSLPEVYIKVNGQRIMNFKKGYVELRIAEGDILSIDCQNYQEPLWFEISYVSPEINNFKQGEQFRIYKSDNNIGIIKFYHKL